MKRPGILGTIGLAGTLIFAIPVVLIGIEMLLSGDTMLGAFFLGLAALMVGMQQYLTTPEDVPAGLAQKVVGVVVKEPDEKE